MIPDKTFNKLSKMSLFLLDLSCDGDEQGFSTDEMDRFSEIADEIYDILAAHGLEELQSLLDDVAAAPCVF